jgi:cobalt/nickel transport system permease protein
MFDPRARLLCTLGAAVAISSTASFWAFLFYAPLLALLGAVSRAPLNAVLARMAPGAPFVFLASATLFLAAGWRAAAIVALRGCALLALAAILAAGSDAMALIRGIASFGAPPSVAIVAVLMLRYINLLQSEWIRLRRARASRYLGPAGGLGFMRIQADQMAILLIRGWERAETIHAAMLTRGFRDAFPAGAAARLRLADWGYILGFGSFFAAVRALA